MMIKVYHIDLRPTLCVKSTKSDPKIFARNINAVVTTGINFQTPRWQLSAILIGISRSFSHREASLYTMDHVPENNFDQTETNNRQIVVV